MRLTRQPSLDIQVSTYLSGLLAEIVGLLNHRGEAIATRLSASACRTAPAAELIDMLMLQDHQPLLAAGVRASLQDLDGCTRKRMLPWNMIALA